MKKFTKEDLLLEEGRSKEKKYTEGVNKRGIHLGQAKLFFSELLFLTNNYTEGTKVLYIGSSRGKHINLFPKLFKGIEVHCYDPSESDIDTNLRGIYEYRQLFGEDEVEEWKKICKKHKVLLISDIRSFNPVKTREEKGKEEEEKNIIQDMNLQRHWVEEIQPYGFHLKFRLPFYYGGDETFEYLDGNVYIQPWNCTSSTEHRLVGFKPYSIKMWNIKRYEDMCFYYNTKIRNTDNEKYMFRNIILNNEEPYNEELKNDIESTITVYTIMKYLNTYNKISNKSTKNDILDKVNDFYLDIMKKITYNTKTIRDMEKKQDKFLFTNKYVIISKEEFSFKGVVYNRDEVISKSKKYRRIFIRNIEEKDREYLLKNIKDKELRYIIKWYPIGRSQEYSPRELRNELCKEERKEMIKYIKKRKFEPSKYYDLLDNCDVDKFIEYESIDFFGRIFNLMRYNTIIKDEEEIENNKEIIDEFFLECISKLSK